MKILIETKELATCLGDSKILVVDTRPFTAYLNGHIPGAINIDLFQFHWLDTSKDGIKEFGRQSRILLSNIGVKATHHVIFYDDVSGMSAARGIWLLLYFSHSNVSLLDGGFKRWQEEGHPVETKTNNFVQCHFVGRPNRKVLATFSDVKKSLRRKDTVIVDARTKEEFTGIMSVLPRAGHIPSAINVDWEENIEHGSFKSPEQLQTVYSSIPKHSKIITYCQGGFRVQMRLLH